MPPYLLVLDLNGTLIERVTGSADKKLANSNPSCPPVPDFFVPRGNRPYLDVFLEEIFSKFAVAAWTSATEKNAHHMFQNTFGAHARRLAFGWNRSHCDIASGRGFVGRKDLRKIWMDPDANAQGTWNEQNTILLDDTVAKATFTPANGLHLPTFTVCDPAFDCRNDPSLLNILLYLRQLHDASPEDVRSYMADNPAFEIGPTGLLSLPAYQIGKEFDGEPLSNVRKARTEQQVDSSAGSSETSDTPSKRAMKKAAKLAKRLQRQATSAGTSPEPYRPAQYGSDHTTPQMASSFGRASGGVSYPAMMTAGARYMHTQSGSRNKNWRNKTSYEAQPAADYDGVRYPDDRVYHHDRAGEPNPQRGLPQSAGYAPGGAPAHQQQFNCQSNSSHHPHNNWQPLQQPRYQRGANSHFPNHWRANNWQPQSYQYPAQPFPPPAPHGVWYPPSQQQYAEPMAYPSYANMHYPQVWRPPGRRPHHTQFEHDNDDGDGENDPR
ncbi:hypothetical protein HDU88_004884 [Geranomyces variabilis]|nr:hypothetical protein HDU88_004884 [Geranomyces variabilis]